MSVMLCFQFAMAGHVMWIRLGDIIFFYLMFCMVLKMMMQDRAGVGCMLYTVPNDIDSEIWWMKMIVQTI